MFIREKRDFSKNKGYSPLIKKGGINKSIMATDGLLMAGRRPNVEAKSLGGLSNHLIL